MAFDPIAYVLSKNYTNAVVAALPKGFVYKGAVNYQADLPATASSGDVYTVVYKGVSPSTEPWGAEFVWGKYQGTDQWIELGSSGGSSYTAGIGIDITNNVISKTLPKIILTYGATMNLTVEQMNILSKNACVILQGITDMSEAYLVTGGGDSYILTSFLPQTVESENTIRYMAITVNINEDGTGTIVASQIKENELQRKLESGTNIKTVNGNSLLGSGNVDVRTYQPYNSSWGGSSSSITVSNFCEKITEDTAATTGMAYSGTIDSSFFFSGIPGLRKSEVNVQIMGTSTMKVILLTATSDDVSPYHWELTYYNHSTEGWHIIGSQVPALPSDASTKTYTLKAVNGTLTWVE